MLCVTTTTTGSILNIRGNKLNSIVIDCGSIDWNMIAPRLTAVSFLRPWHNHNLEASVIHRKGTVFIISHSFLEICLMHIGRIPGNERDATLGPICLKHVIVSKIETVLS